MQSLFWVTIMVAGWIFLIYIVMDAIFKINIIDCTLIFLNKWNYEKNSVVYNSKLLKDYFLKMKSQLQAGMRQEKMYHVEPYQTDQILRRLQGIRLVSSHDCEKLKTCVDECKHINKYLDSRSFSYFELSELDQKVSSCIRTLNVYLGANDVAK